MKVVYCVNWNISQISYIINIYKINPGPLLFLNHVKELEVYNYYVKYFNKPIILTSLSEVEDYGPNALIWTDFNYLLGNWLNVFIGHGDLISCRPLLQCYTYKNRDKLEKYDIVLVAGKVQLDKYISVSPKSKCYLIGSPRYDTFKRYDFFNNNRQTIIYTPTWRVEMNCVATFYKYLNRLLANYNIIIAFHSLFLKRDQNYPIFLKLVNITNPCFKILYRNNFHKYLHNENSIQLDDESDLLSLVNSSDIQISDSMSSSMIDGFYLQKPVIVFNNSISYNELISEINKKQLNYNLNKMIIVLGVKYKYEDVFKYNDGLSSRRALTTIQNVLDNIL